MTAQQATRLRKSLAYWRARALAMDHIGDRERNRTYTARANALRDKLALGLVAERMARECHSAAFVRQFRVLG